MANLSESFKPGTDTGYRIVGVVASFMDSSQRLEYFEHMMESIFNQSVMMDALYIGMSFANREVSDELEPRLRDIVKKCRDLPIRFIRKPKKTAQGVMWHNLIKKIPDLSGPRTWILFGDDDDLWHPSRVKLYRESIEHSLRCNLNISDVRSTCYAIASDGDQPRSSSDVDVLWEQKRLTLKRTVGGHRYDGDFQQGGNYVDHCVRAGIFAEFVQISNLFMRSNLQFDVMLQRYICSYGASDGVKNVILKPDRTKCWLYFWRINPDSVCHNMVDEQKQAAEAKDLNKFLRIVADRVMSRLPKWKDAVSTHLEQHIAADDSDRHRKITRILRYSREIARLYPRAIQEMMCIPDMTLPEMFKMAMDADDEWVGDHRIEMHSRIDQYQNCTPDNLIKLHMHQMCEGNSELENALTHILVLRIQDAVVVAPLIEQLKQFPRVYNFARAFQL